MDELQAAVIALSHHWGNCSNGCAGALLRQGQITLCNEGRSYLARATGVAEKTERWEKFWNARREKQDDN